jgi:hypothetical protein
MKNPFGWILGFVWMITTKIHIKLRPHGGSMWLPRWIQPYWMRCMGFEVSDAVLESYKGRK